MLNYFVCLYLPKKAMKNTARITQRLVSLFLVFVASSMMFLPSPAIAATSWITLSNSDVDPSKLETELLNYSEPTIVFLTPKDTSRDSPDCLEKVKSHIEKFYGDKYKYVTGVIEENEFLYRTHVPNSLRWIRSTPLPAIVPVKNRHILLGSLVDSTLPARSLEPVLEKVKEQLDETS
jgi:hypothetical protein